MGKLRGVWFPLHISSHHGTEARSFAMDPVNDFQCSSYLTVRLLNDCEFREVTGDYYGTKQQILASIETRQSRKLPMGN